MYDILEQGLQYFGNRPKNMWPFREMLTWQAVCATAIFLTNLNIPNLLLLEVRRVSVTDSGSSGPSGLAGDDSPKEPEIGQEQNLACFLSLPFRTSM
jgi:hypothetical protein